MFTKSSRFSFKRALPKNVFHSPSFNLRYEKNEATLKVAVVVSKKVDKRATVRNKVKRQLLEALRNKISNDENLNLVFYIKNNALNRNNLDLEKEIGEAINSLK